MRILKAEAISTLTEENARLTNQMQLCESQERTMLSVSAQEMGLLGEAWSAVEQRIHMRPLVIRTHYFAYAAIKEGNLTHIRALSALPDSTTPGVLDTEECEREIERQKSNIAEFENTCSSLINKVTQHSVDYGESGPWATINQITSHYGTLIAACKTIIQEFENIKDAADTFSDQSYRFYVDAQCYVFDILAQSTSAVQSCIATGTYDASLCRTLTEGINEVRIDLARPYLTEEELAALRQALEDGTIGTDEIYDSGTFNEQLYSALAKLPDFMVKEDDVQAIADAYNNMWTRGHADAIRRFFEVSYLRNDSVAFPYFHPYTCHDQNLDTRDYVLFERSSLMDRVSACAQTDMLLRNKDSDSYHWYLAAANLIADVSASGSQMWCTPDGLDAELFAYTTRVTGELATISVLRFNSTIFNDDPKLNQSFENNPAYSIPASGTFISVSGEERAICNLLSEYRNAVIANEMLRDANEEYTDAELNHVFNALGFVYGTPLDVVLSKIPFLTNVLGLVDSAASLQAERQDLAFFQEASSGITDTTFSRIAASLNDNTVINECGFSLNISTFNQQRTAASNVCTPPFTRIYVSNASRDILGSLVAAYNNCTGRSYETETFLEEIASDTYNSVVSGGNHNSTYYFVAWCNAPAHLVYAEDVPGFGISSGDEASVHDTNYIYITTREDSNNNLKYPWE